MERHVIRQQQKGNQPQGSRSILQIVLQLQQQENLHAEKNP